MLSLCILTEKQTDNSFPFVSLIFVTRRPSARKLRGGLTYKYLGYLKLAIRTRFWYEYAKGPARIWSPVRKTCNKQKRSPEAHPIVVVPYLHGITHRLKKIASRQGVHVVCSAPNKASSMCEKNQQGTKHIRKTMWRSTQDQVHPMSKRGHIDDSHDMWEMLYRPSTTLYKW